MSAESDARTLANLRRWRTEQADLLALVPDYRVPLRIDELDLLLAAVDERDQLRRDLCDEQQGRGRRPIGEVQP
mgnify:CR=1 FL=1